MPDHTTGIRRYEEQEGKEVRPITIVVGGQYGSEAKGSVAGYLIQRDRHNFAVRTGCTNAGHSVDFMGTVYVNQQLPVAWICPTTQLVLGAGAIIDIDILEREISMIDAAMPAYASVRNRITIDPRAFIHKPAYADLSRTSGRHHAIGATGKGCSEAVVDRVKLRGIEDGSFGADPRSSNYIVQDTEKLLNDAIDMGASIMLEGCQGTLLDLVLGPYPYTTHKQTTVAQWMSESGLSPSLPVDVVMVVRTFPIRVAGNSGPLDHEISWPALARYINAQRGYVGKPPIVREASIIQFEQAVRSMVTAVMSPSLTFPSTSDGLDMHKWTREQRAEHRAALSETHKLALLSLDPDTVRDLRNLFEMTTVTKKLRRIAGLSRKDLITASRQVRPHQVAVTFLNYQFPEFWCEHHEVTEGEREWLTENVASVCRAPVTLINRGPLMPHMSEVD